MAPNARPPENEAPLPSLAARILAEVAQVLESSRERLVESLALVPGQAEYAAYVTRLRAAAAAHPELKAIVDQAPRLGTPLREGLQGIAQVAADLKGAGERVHDARLALGASGAPGFEEVNQALQTLRDMLETQANGRAELAELSTSLRAVAEMTTPLVDSLSDLSHTAEILRSLPGAVAGAAGATPADGNSDVGDWAANILRGVRELAAAIGQGQGASPAQEQRLWESVRDLHLEVVHLKGILLAPARRPPDELS
jgi:hypothetical protein